MKEELEKNILKILKVYTKDYPQELKKGIFYAIAKGKRIRPLIFLSLLKNKRINISKKEVMKIALAIELIHNFSLVHDDLPAIDNDDYRRGRLTCHKVFGEGNAILIGDALFSLAFKILADVKIKDGLKIDILKILSKATTDLVVGEFLDINKKITTKKEYLEIAKRKTGALFRAVYEIAALLLGLPLKKRKEYAFYGENYGILFQIEDDIEDKFPLPFLLELKNSLTRQLANKLIINDDK
uniref:Polyprenyl synthetase family protein n=1 Tax=candidate division WOR-3 bacterium TaxID=2052148 RepID=A0A7V3ZU93_UNCW3